MVASIALSAFAYAAHWYRCRGWKQSPDGFRYAEAGSGKRVPLPFSRRWFLPWLLGPRLRVWGAVTASCWVATGVVLYLLTDSLVATWLWVWLPGMAVNVRLPQLCDAPAILCGVLAGLFARHDYPTAVALCLIMAGLCKEPGSLFGLALLPGSFLWWAAPLSFGMVALSVLVGRRRAALPPKDQPWLTDAWKMARTHHDLLDFRSMLVPWGALLVLGAVAMHSSWSWQVAAALTMAYGQLLVASDETRLYQWAAPALVVLCVGVGVPDWGWPLVAAHPFWCGVHRGI